MAISNKSASTNSKPNKASNNTSFGDAIKQAIEVVKLNGQAAINISRDTSAVKNGILIIIIAGFIASIPNFSLVNLILTPVLLLIFVIIGIGVTHILAKLFGGIAAFKEYFRAESHVSILGWINILLLIPLLGILISLIVPIWQLIVSVNVLKNIHKLSTVKSIIVILLPVIVFTILIIIGSLSYFSAVNPDLILPQT